MVEEERTAEERPSVSTGDSAIAAALSLGSASRDAADAFLSEQTQLARRQVVLAAKQSHHLDEQLKEISLSLIDRRLTVALKVLTVIVGVALAGCLAIMIWKASQADGLVVDSFSVPPSFAAAGVSGDVVADDMTAKIASIRDVANENSLARSSDVSEDHSRDVKVEIPATGISFDDAWKYLKLWFGHERHLTGNVRTAADGTIALTASLGGADSFTFTGKDLGSLEQKAAEQVFGDVDPGNIVLYFDAQGRRAEMIAAARHLVEQSRGKDVAEAYSLYGNMLRYATGDVRRSLVLTEMAIRLDPKAIPQHMETLVSSRLLGHDEEVLKQSRAMVPLRREDNVGAWRNPSSTGFSFAKELGAIWGDRETGDFADLSRLPLAYVGTVVEVQLTHAEAMAFSHDPQGAQAQIASAVTASHALSTAADHLDPGELAEVQARADVARQDWRAAASDAQALFDFWKGNQQYSAKMGYLIAQTRAAPLLTQALAQQGDFAKAWATINATPRDCYTCVRMRGQIATLQKNWTAAGYWFSDAVKQAPSIPFAYSEWGVMLLAKGDLNGAIAKFAVAHEKGPHFADPLELWGEALIAQNRSDLALAKFAEAAQYAPNWGRLHLKWGEALLWSGKKDEAQKQFAIAAKLDLTNTERQSLARWAHV